MPRKDIINTPKTKKQLQAKTSERRKRATSRVIVETRAALPIRNDLQPDLVVVDRGIDSLHPPKRRTRRTSDEQLANVMRSLQEFGQVLPILIDEEDRIVAGHIVWEAMRKLGALRIQCIVLTHLNEPQRRALSLTLNRLGETGEWDLDELKLEFDDLVLLDIDLELTGFTLQEIDIIRMPDIEPEERDADSDDDEDEVEVIALPGDLFALGDHVLLCGDSLDSASYERLLGEERAQFVFSDPPYNCPIPGHVSGLGKKTHGNFAMAVGEMSDEGFFQFLRSYLDHCRSWTRPGAVIAACMDWRQIDLLLMAGRSLNLHRINMAVWNKGSGGMGAYLRSAYELIALFCDAPSPAINNVELGKHGRDRTNVWTMPGANRRGSSASSMLGEHPTPKPIPLVADAILDVTVPGDIVLDPFMGSGATLMAAEQTGRICRGIELDPKYVDVTIRRWQQATGQRAVHVASGLTWTDLAEQRSEPGE